MSLQQKQQYLRTEIVDKGYDAQKFYQFWQSYGVDLSTASLQHVISIVEQFQQKIQDDKNNQDQFGDYVQPEQHHDSHFHQDLNWDFLADKNDKTHTNRQQNGKNNSKIQKVIKQQIIQSPTIPTTKAKNIQKQQQPKQTNKSQPKQKTKKNQNLLNQDIETPNINNVTFQDVIKDSQSIKRKCLKLQPNILEHHINVEIFITKFKEITDQNTGLINKLWKSSYLLFTIKTIGRNKQKAIGISWEVQRQHADFEWLRNTLIKMYPGLVVPPLPAPVKSQDQLNGYQRKLQSFLLDCYNCPQLRNSKYFQVFLSYASQKDFQAFKKSCETTSKPKNLTHILNMQGQLSLLYSQKIESYTQGLQNFINKTSQHLKNVKTIIKQIDDSYSQISTKYKQLSEVFIVMSEQSCQFSEQQCYPRLTQTYRQISQLINQHSYFCMLQKQFLQTFMFSHFAYEKDRVDNMQNLISKRKTFTLQFAKPKHQNQIQKPPQSTGTSVFGKIANLFGQKSQSLDIPSTQSTTLRDQVGYYNAQLMKQSIRTVQGMITSHINHFSMYGHSRIDNVESMQKLWSKIMVQLSRLKMK